ncbi:Tic20 family protein [Aliinostoc sp. HNIBRCY26]|uniref:Tic20 family protein n=1 Tax=Aliinostoc sp. HNIBRCY26 TaxID=3418997 RepID=UPI003CFC989E
MVWRGTTSITDRIFACLPYLLPLINSLVFGSYLLGRFPILQLLLIPLQPIVVLYMSLGQLGRLLLFFALFIFVVRNEKIVHFIRFNTMQAILLNIVIFLCEVLRELLGFIPNTGFAIETISNLVFVVVVGTVVYSMIQSLLGRYAELPTISDAVYTQVR